ncbi:Translation initiation factor 3 subunit b, partial [Bonamia ostreae]
VLHSSFSPMKPLLAAVYVFKNQYHVSVFDLKKDEEIVHLQREKVNRVLWSPCGLRLVAVGLSSGGDACNGGLVFVDCETRLVIKKQSHFNCNSADWSPFGRFLMTAILDKSGLVDNRTAQRSYNIYDSAGELVVSQNSSQLKQFLWRPRPKLKESAEPNSEKRQELEKLDESVRLLNVNEEERLRGNRLTNYRNAMAGLACSLEEERKLIEKLRKDLIVVSLEEEVEIEKDVRVEVERFVEEMDQ